MRHQTTSLTNTGTRRPAMFSGRVADVVMPQSLPRRSAPLGLRPRLGLACRGVVQKVPRALRYRLL